MREWLVSNSLGSFAMGTPQRMPERKYHGLLIVRNPGTQEPLHVLADVAERVSIGDSSFELASWRYGDLTHPTGTKYLGAFESLPTPTWIYHLAHGTITRRFKLCRDRNRVELTYTLDGVDTAELLLQPHFSARGIHRLAYENPFLDGRATRENGFALHLYRNFSAIRCGSEPAAEFEADGFWNRGVIYAEEQRRGYPAREDLFCPGMLRATLRAGQPLTMYVEVQGEWPLVDPVLVAPEVEAAQSLLENAADAFLFVEHGSARPGVIAGYPWFGEWSRDTMIALPGLTLARGRGELAAAILDRYAGLLRDGLLPNLIGSSAPDSDGVCVDASLWFIRSVQAAAAELGKIEAERWLPAVFEILSTLRSGRVPGVHVTEQGLLWVDRRPMPSSWMDAVVDGQAVTPRAPMAVELNALFYNAVCFALEAARHSGEREFARDLGPVAKDFRKSFHATFWLPERGYLADVSDGKQRDESLRPNQLIAASLPFKAISQADARRMVEATGPLVTRFGLRTLAPGHPSYHARVLGDQRSRDQAYHQGTVWPWLIGSYLDALAFARGTRAAAREAWRFRETFTEHLGEACVGQISEIFDGDEPHVPRGAPAQAWSVAELLRVLEQYREPVTKRTRRASSKVTT